VVPLCPSCLHVEHFFFIPPLLTWMSSFFISDACNLLFFLGLSGSIRFSGGSIRCSGGSTSGKGVISQISWAFTGYMIEQYISSYEDLVNQCATYGSTLRFKNFIAARECEHGMSIIPHFLQLPSMLSTLTTNFSPIVDTCQTSKSLSADQLYSLKKEHILLNQSQS